MPRQPRSRKVRRDQLSPSPMTLSTLEKIEERATRRLESGSRSFMHDSSSPAYSWLLPGWLAEERLVANGRVYKYYYDPAGRQYRHKYEVVDTWEKLGLVVLDA